MSLFNFKHPISFLPIDPLGDGLREDIIAEQLEPEAITLEEEVDEAALAEYWQDVERDIEKDPTWFRFDDEGQ